MAAVEACAAFLPDVDNVSTSLPLGHGVREFLTCNGRQMCCLIWWAISTSSVDNGESYVKPLPQPAEPPRKMYALVLPSRWVHPRSLANCHAVLSAGVGQLRQSLQKRCNARLKAELFTAVGMEPISASILKFRRLDSKKFRGQLIHPIQLHEGPADMRCMPLTVTPFAT